LAVKRKEHFLPIHSCCLLCEVELQSARENLSEGIHHSVSHDSLTDDSVIDDKSNIVSIGLLAGVETSQRQS